MRRIHRHSCPAPPTGRQHLDKLRRNCWVGSTSPSHRPIQSGIEMTAAPAPLHPFHASPTEILKCERRGDVDGLLEMLDLEEVRGSRRLRADLARSLGKVTDERAVRAVEDLARCDADRGVRANAIYALASRGSRASVPFFAEQLTSEDPNMRMHAIHGLANSRLSEAVAPLIAALQGDRDATCRSAAARGLAAIGDRAALEPIRAAVRRARWRPWSRFVLRMQLSKLEERL